MMRLSGLAAAIALISGSALAQNADFTLVNATEYPISEVYVSPTKAQSWGADVLGKHTISHGDAWKLSFPQSKEQCTQDMKIVFEDDNSSVIWENLNLCETDKITLSYDRKTGVTTAKRE